MARAWMMVTTLLMLAGCGGARPGGLTADSALLDFRNSNLEVATILDRAAAVAVFIGVEGSEAGGPHDGVLILPDGSRQPVVLRCLEATPAPGGYSYHQLVVFRDESQLEALLAGPIPLDRFVHLEADALLPPEVLGDAPGWVVSTHRPQLLFGDQTVRQQIERMP